MIGVENNRKIEDLIRSTKSRQPTYFNNGGRANQLRLENEKIIKLIREKMYPLHASDKSALVFPKLKEKYYSLSKHNSQHSFKKYIEINLEDERGDPQIRARTDLEEELVHKFQLNQIKKSKEYERSEFTAYTKLIKLKKKTLKRIETIGSEVNELNRQSTDQGDKVDLTSTNFNLDEEEMAQQELYHSEYLTRLKSEFQKQKELYLKKINITDLCQGEGSKDKENINIQYIVSLLQRKTQRQHGGSVSAYEGLSPNRLSSYMQLLNHKKERTLKLWEQFEKSSALKQKISEQESKNGYSDQQQQPLQKNIAVVEDECQFQQQNILSAKYRMKSNHRKLVQISKLKGS